MVEKQGDFAVRFEQLRNGRPYQDISDAIFERFEVRITPQAMNKWVKQGGGITPDNARIVAQFFGVEPGWLLFGEGHPGSPHIEDMILDLPGDDPQQAIDFLEYKIQRANKFMAAEKLASYMTMIERIRADLEHRKTGKP